MQKIILKTVVCCLCALIYIIPKDSSANSAEEGAVVVIASRTPTIRNLLGGGLNILNKETIVNSRAIFIPEILKRIPGVAISRSGPIGTARQARIRGAEANHVLVLIDGIEANDLAAGSEFDFSHLFLSNIEKIEVMRGAQSTLWGSDALAGVINIITDNAIEDRQIFTSLTGKNNTYNNYFNLAKIKDKYSFSLYGNQYATDNRNISETGSENDNYKNETWHLKTMYLPKKNTDLEFIARYTNARTETDNYDYSISKPIDAKGYETKIKRLYSRGQAKITSLDGKWVNIFELTYVETKNKDYKDYIWDSLTQGYKTKTSYQSHNHLNNLEKYGISQDFVFVIEKEREKFKQRGIKSGSSDPNQKQYLTNKGYIIEYKANYKNSALFNISMRHDSNSDFKDENLYSASLTLRDKKNNNKFYIKSSTGVKNPTFTERFGFYSNTFKGNPNLKPEKSKTWEFGIEQNLINNDMAFSINVFREQLMDEIDGAYFDANLGTFTARNKTGKSYRDGFELVHDAKITDNLSVSSSYTYVDSTEENSAGKETSEIRRPKVLFNFNADYSFLEKQANLNLNLHYTGEQYDTDFSTTPNRRVTLDAYSIIDVGFTYAFSKNFKFVSRIENFFNEDFQDVYGYETLGRSIYAGVEASF